MLGLNQPAATPIHPNHFDSHPSTESPEHHQPSMDALRERAFSGLDSFYEPEEPKTGGRRIFLMIILLAALGGSGWYIYANYLRPGENQKPEAAGSSTNEPSAEQPSKPAIETPADTAQTKPAMPAPDAAGSPLASSVAAPERPSDRASANPNTTSNTADETSSKSAPAARTPATPDAAPVNKHLVKAVPKPLPAETADTGDAAFKKGEAYLYGRGAPQNCNEAVQNLKAAAAKSNAKARSTFGTMYATGHCVPRDLPTSYMWFALALRVDPNNQILEKDLSAIWNQMTPPERQLATRMKQ
jgi:hypothetical protein